MTRFVPALLLPVLFAATLVLAESVTRPVTFASGPEKVTLLELYTSEGCSSCPPADRWLSDLKEHPDLWDQVIPLAFHVDYWDYIGWEDRFADRSFSDRQRRYAAQASARTVYTPGMFRNGAEWLGWRYDESLAVPPREAGALTIAVRDEHLVALFETTARKDLQLHVALLGMDLKTEVRAGENRGRTLNHDFVVLAHSTTTLKAASEQYTASLPLPVSDINAPRRALVAWVSDASHQGVLQATGGLLNQDR